MFCLSTKSCQIWPICSSFTHTQFCWRIRTTLFHRWGFTSSPFWHFSSVWQGKCRETPPWYFSSFCKSFSFFCYPETLFKAARILPFISCGHIFAFGCLCHFNTLQTLQASSLETSSLCPPKGQLQSQWSFCDSHSFIILKSSNKEICKHISMDYISLIM